MPDGASKKRLRRSLHALKCRAKQFIGKGKTRARAKSLDRDEQRRGMELRAAWAAFFVGKCVFPNAETLHIIIIWYICKGIKTRTMETKVIWVHLFEGRKNYFFGSITAVFETLTEEQVGVTKSHLLHVGLSDEGKHLTKRALIMQSRLRRCKKEQKKRR